MAHPIIDDSDFLMARIHAKRATIVDGTRLNELCQIKTIPELARTIGFEGITTPSALKQAATKRFYEEIATIIPSLGPTEQKYARLILKRSDIEKQKHELRKNDPANCLQQETELDTSYFHSLSVAGTGTPFEALSQQSAATYLALLALRTPATFSAQFYFPNTNLAQSTFQDIAQNKEIALPKLTGIITDTIVYTSQALERATKLRYQRLATKLFRHAHMQQAAAIAYIAMRENEIRTITTLSEAMRMNLPTQVIRTYFQ